MKEISVTRLKEMMENGDDFQLIDVREPHEYDICNLNGELIPMGELAHMPEKVSRDKPVIIHCRSGARSGQICEFFEARYGFDNLYNLKGGVLAWSDEIDPSMPKY